MKGSRHQGWVGAAIVVAAVAHAAALSWLGDDAFISFRYARHLVLGQGLVYNVGERVEGYSNPSWTLLMAGALRLGVSAERASIVLGIAAYAVGIAALVVAHGRLQRSAAERGEGTARLSLPVAALVGALHPDWATFATSGLETSLFTTLVLLGAVALLLAPPDEGGRRFLRAMGRAGAFFGLAAITRHEGVLVAALAGAWLSVSSYRRGRSLRRTAQVTAVFTLAALVAWAPLTVWRWRYYGDVLPNTYYAKSGGGALWGTGLRYVGLYISRSWTVPLSLLAAIAAAFAPGRASAAAVRWRKSSGSVALGASFLALGYSLYIARVGGDFMFARMLVPVTPLFLLVLDAAALRAGELARAPVATAAALVVALLQFLTPCPVSGEEGDVVDERAYYDDAFVQRQESQARVLDRFFHGIPARVAIYGSQARLAYLAPFDTVIEARAGLTDAHIAHQPLTSRGRVGHEKSATFDYLVHERRVDFTFSRFPVEKENLDAYVPTVMADFGGVKARMLHWDPNIVAALRARGAVIEDFPTMLDGLTSQLDQLPDAVVRAELARCDHFYFDGGYDEPRRARFLARLSSPRP